jgi:hypothetical protein
MSKQSIDNELLKVKKRLFHLLLNSTYDELLEAKKHLYHLLLEKGSENWTKTELEIAFNLARDKSIQVFLTKVFNKGDELK